MLIRKATEVHGKRYHLEPGDGSAYEFSITDWDLEENVSNGTVQGIGSGDYVTLTIHRPYTSVGSYEVSKCMLRYPHAHDVAYLRSPGHGFETSVKYTLAAIMLAAGVLVDNPNNLDGACEEMLRAPQVLSGKE